MAECKRVVITALAAVSAGAHRLSDSIIFKFPYLPVDGSWPCQAKITSISSVDSGATALTQTLNASILELSIAYSPSETVR